MAKESGMSGITTKDVISVLGLAIGLLLSVIAYLIKQDVAVALKKQEAFAITLADHGKFIAEASIRFDRTEIQINNHATKLNTIVEDIGEVKTSVVKLEAGIEELLRRTTSP